MRTGLIAAMEDIDNVDAVAVEETPEAITAVAVADETAEVQADGDEIGVTVSQVEEAVQAGEELEDIADVATAAVESGEGFDEKTAEVASIAIESIRNRLGAGSSMRLVPACESFGNSNTRLTSTKLVIEGVSDFLKKIWLAVKQACLRVWEMLKSFFAKLFNLAGLLSKNIKALQTRAAAMPSTAVPKEATIKTGIAKAISVKGKADLASFDVMLKNTVVLASVADSVNKTTVDIAKSAAALAGTDITEAAVAKFLNDEDAGSKKIMGLVQTAFTDAHTAFVDAELPVNEAVKKPNVDAKYYGPFAGNAALAVVAEKKDDKVFVGLQFGTCNAKVADTVDALTLAQVKTILASSGELATKLMDFKKVQSDVEGITKLLVKTADSVLSHVGKIVEKTGENKETSKGLAEMKSATSSVLKMLQGFSNKAPTYMFALAKAGSDYASVSMRNLGEKAAA